MEQYIEGIKEIATQNLSDGKAERIPSEAESAISEDAEKEKAWKIYIDSSFWGHYGRGKAGDEIPVKENPLNIRFHSGIVLNGTQLHQKVSTRMAWIPDSCRPEEVHNETEWSAIIKHYQLDKNKGWVICRYSYLWDYKEKPTIQSLKVHLEQQPVSVVGMKFKTPEKGKEYVVTHPVTGVEHKIVIGNMEKQELEIPKVKCEEYEYPLHFTTMSYTITPKLDAREFSICDCGQSDTPRRIQQESGSVAGAISVIGRVDGPTSIFIAGKRSGSQMESQLYSASSALHFQPRDEVEWKLVFRVKRCEDIIVEVI